MTSTRTRSLIAAVTLSVAALAAVAAQDDECRTGCLKARYWHVPLASRRDLTVTFPETEPLKKARPDTLDFGVAFSGGGTRSASAAVGQLRALHHLHQLFRLKISCLFCHSNPCGRRLGLGARCR